MAAAALALAIVVSPTGGADSGSAHSQCRFQSLDPGTWTQHEETRTAWCVLNRWPVPGGFAKLSSVINCESGWNRFAYNAAGYVGLAQHAISSWAYRVAHYRPTWWTLKTAWWNPRTALTVTVRMVRDLGWSPWSCA